jgi:hypothetical protein
MPAFGDALSDDEIDAVIGYLRTFCTDPRWVRGEFNFALGLFTEKAFPGGRTGLDDGHRCRSPNNIESQFVFEKADRRHRSAEFTLPFARIDGGPALEEFRRGRFRRGLETEHHSPMSIPERSCRAGEAVLPTGSERKGLGTGSMAFETHALFGQKLPDDFVFKDSCSRPSAAQQAHAGSRPESEHRKTFAKRTAMAAPGLQRSKSWAVRNGERRQDRVGHRAADAGQSFHLQHVLSAQAIAFP